MTEVTRPTIVTDEVVERVARAIYEADPVSGCYGELKSPISQFLAWADAPYWAHEAAAKQARAVLAAMPAIVGGE